MFDVETILTEAPPFLITIEINRDTTELDIIPHWYSGDDFCCFYIFQAGKELGTVICADINEWEWLTDPDLNWLAQLVGNEIDWHFV
ncbi:hypothetical protein GS399_13475 [Pedobacter sp. HMF7647]|uniref:Uncharacterized protein n=1 Tax=Hufsiella arboris TaxID=2695275 RepID=A0A7K1YBL4_9SPHI|nr:hypothetical protein [Hufsiella arboris]MXV51987.1 hypothetical protein [Hufsiella arboris]